MHKIEPEYMHYFTPEFTGHYPWIFKIIQKSGKLLFKFLKRGLKRGRIKNMSGVIFVKVGRCEKMRG